MNNWKSSWEPFEEDSVWCDFFYTELTTGLRRGEICGLKWEDFDEAHSTLKVRRTIHEEKGGKLTAWDTKTAAGTRTIHLSPSTAALLRERKKTALTEWIFPHPWKPEQPTRPSAAYERMKILLKEAGLPDLRFHDLRHTFATHALTSGVDVKTLVRHPWDTHGPRSHWTPILTPQAICRSVRLRS